MRRCARLGQATGLVAPMAAALQRHVAPRAAWAAAQRPPHALLLQLELASRPCPHAAAPAASQPSLASSSGRSSFSSMRGAACCSAAQQRSGGEASTSGRDDAAAHKQARPKKQRLDDYCLGLHPEYSKNLIQSWIVQGKVLINDRVVTKAGTPVPKNAAVRINAEQPKYVCRAGHKLEAALEHFQVDVAGLTALDAGLSTGGFTDCLLQRGVGRVFGVDVGYGQVVGSIAQDPRVTVMERTNLRHLRPEDLPCKVDLVTLDLSFISVLKVMPAVVGAMRPEGAQLVVLIKPQFEAGKALVSAGGVVRDPKVHAEVIERISRGIQAYNLQPRGIIESPLKGDKGGNTEFLAHFVHDPAAGPLRWSAEQAAAAAAAAAASGDEEEEQEGGLEGGGGGGVAAAG